jgi:DHA2 family multidrug resistance protein-like MFS transporter
MRRSTASARRPHEQDTEALRRSFAPPSENASAAMTDWNGLPPPRRHWSIIAIWLAITMAVLDASIANVALPAIARDLHAAAAESIWVVNAYQLAIVVALLPLAALGEILEYRRIFQAGLILFVLASIGCCLANTLPELTVARAAQGFGAAGVMSVNGALVRFTYPHSQLGRGVGLNALVVSVASVLGPSVASAILALGSWQWLFAVNVPIGVAAWVLGRIALPESPRQDRRLDWIAAALNVATFGLIIAGVNIFTRGGGSLFGLVVAAAGIVCGVVLVRRSLSQPRPLAPVDLMRSPQFSLTVLTSVASFAAQMLAFVALPFYFQATLHRTQVETGLLITPWPLAVGVAAPIAGRLADRFPAAILAGIGLTALASGLLFMATLPADVSSFGICLRMALCGLGFGFFQAPNNRTMLSSTPMERSGAAGGMLATSRLTGQTIGATLTAILFRMSGHGAVSALALGAAFAAVASVVSFSRLAGRRS